MDTINDDKRGVTGSAEETNGRTCVLASDCLRR